MRRQIYALDRNMAVFNEETMEEHVHSAFFLPRLAATLFSVFGGIGLVLATVGLYGVMSYAVSRRTREIGIRMAMGAQPGTVERLVLRQGLVLTLIAVALGWPAAWMLSKLAASFLYGIHPHDALTFAVVPPFLAAIALVACWIPARRAASVEPMRGIANGVGHPVQLVTVARDGGFGVLGHVIQQGFARLLQVFIKERKRERLRKP